jgi:uncharacterized membrane protein
VSTASPDAGTHSQPTLTSGTQTTTTATITNTGKSTISDVKVSLQAPAGWTTSAVSPASFGAIVPGKSETVTYGLVRD